MNSIWASCTCGGTDEKSEYERESVPYQPQALEVNVSKLRQEEEYLREKLDYEPMDPRKVKILSCFKQDHVVDKYDMLKPAQKIRLSNDCELLEMDLIDLVPVFLTPLFLELSQFADTWVIPDSQGPEAATKYPQFCLPY